MAKANVAIPLTNAQLIEASLTNKKVRVLVIRPTDGAAAFDEKMLVSAHITDQKNYAIKVPLAGTRMWVIKNNDERFLQKDRGYIFQAYPL